MVSFSNQSNVNRAIKYVSVTFPGRATLFPSSNLHFPIPNPFLFYRPQRSWGKVMFLQVCVILFTGGECLTRYPPQDQVPPRARYPPGTRYPPLGPGTPPRTRYPPGPGTPPWARYPSPGPGTPPRHQVHPPGPGTPPAPGTPPRDQVPPPGPGRYGLRAGGTHPTGMHSCFNHKLNELFSFICYLAML